MQAVCPECNTLNPIESKFCGNCGASLDSAKVVKPVEGVDQGSRPVKKETTYYSAGGVQVTSTRAVLGAKTYAMANITSVSMAHDPPKRLIAISVCGIGIVATIIGIATVADSWLCLGGGILLTLFGLFLMFFQKHEYIVRVGSASGESDALKSSDKVRIEKIVAAIHRAIIERG